MDRKKSFEILGVISLIISGYLIGSAEYTAYLFLVLITACIIFALIKHKGSGSVCFEYISITSISTAVSLLALTVIPKLFIHDFLSIPAILGIYILPVLLIFFISLHITEELFYNSRFEIIHLKSAIGHCMIILWLISVIIGLVGLYYYKTNSAEYDESILEALGDTAKYIESGKSENLTVFREINEYGKKEIADIMNMEYSKKDCLNDFCVPVLGNKAYTTARAAFNKVLISSYIMTGKNAKEELNGTNLTEYIESAKRNISELYYPPVPLGYEYRHMLDLVDGEFTYSKMEEVNLFINEKYEFDILIAEPKSPLFNSFRHMLMHSDLGREFTRLIVRIMVLSEHSFNHPDIYTYIYENMDTEESELSKAIRLRLIERQIRLIHTK